MAANAEAIATRLKSEDLGDRLQAVNQVRALDAETALVLLSTAAQDDSARVRYAAISQIGTLSLNEPSEVLPLLRQALFSDPEVDVRAAAAAALGDLQQPEALPDLLQAYEREKGEWLIAFSVVAAMGQLGDARAYDTIVSALQGDEPLVQTVAAAALGDLGDPRAVEVLVPLIESEDWQLRYRTALSLSRLGGDVARSALETLANDEIEQVAEQSRAALAQWQA
ncbi:MAG: HEAT repeat domain-containing protein [Cyanobacteria bacterium J06648_11]